VCYVVPFSVFYDGEEFWGGQGFLFSISVLLHLNLAGHLVGFRLVLALVFSGLIL